MTVGEKIQLHRKEIGLSQEELGQRLLVSRQTVSLWEMDKTVPTVDNLIRLKEIFGVSIDELLTDDADEAECTSEEEESSGEVDEPLEKYEFTYSMAEMKEVNRATLKQLSKGFWIFFALSAAPLILSVATKEQEGVIGFCLAIFILSCIALVYSRRSHRKSWESNSARVVESVYGYEIFDGYFVVRISRGGVEVSMQRIELSKIKARQTVGELLIVDADGQLYIFREKELCEGSLIASVPISSNPPAAKKNKPSPLMKAVSLCLIIASVASLWVALSTVGYLTEVNRMIMTDNMWAFYLFTPIPIASIVVGAVLNKRGQRGAANVAVGIVMTVLLCLFGSFWLIDGGVSYGDEKLLAAEERIGIDLPEPIRVATQDWTEGEQDVPRGYIYYTSDIYFGEEGQGELEDQIAAADKWVSGIPSDLVGVAGVLYDPIYYDAMIVYNVDTGELNTLPDQSGSYRFITLLYDRDEAQVTMLEYTIDYIK